jgi:hypothetical protein
VLVHNLLRVTRRVLCMTAVVWALAAAASLLPATAGAAGLSPAVADCNTHNHLTHHYSIAQLRNALATMPADIQEYTNCQDVIQRQLLAQLGTLRGNRGSGSGGGSFLPTPVIVVLVLIVVGGVGFGTYAWRRRGQ